MYNKSKNITSNLKKPENETFSNIVNRKFKPLEQLNMMDSFLFEAVTEEPQAAKRIAEIIIERATGHKPKNLTVESQKQLKGIHVSARGIRMDVYTTEYTDAEENAQMRCVYDIEPNKYYEPNIAKRDRYYQALIDSKLLSTDESYFDLPNLVSIWILPYDPFGLNKMIYTIKNMVDNNENLLYNDGVTKIILYTKGCTGGTLALKNLLTFLEDSTSLHATDSELQEIQHLIDKAKANPEVKEAYMGHVKLYCMDPIDYITRDWGIEIGETRGEVRGKMQGIIQACKAMDLDKSKTAEMLFNQCGITQEEAEDALKLYW